MYPRDRPLFSMVESEVLLPSPNVEQQILDLEPRRVLAHDCAVWCHASQGCAGSQSCNMGCTATTKNKNGNTRACRSAVSASPGGGGHHQDTPRVVNHRGHDSTLAAAGISGFSKGQVVSFPEEICKRFAYKIGKIGTPVFGHMPQACLSRPSTVHWLSHRKTSASYLWSIAQVLRPKFWPLWALCSTGCGERSNLWASKLARLGTSAHQRPATTG